MEFSCWRVMWAAGIFANPQRGMGLHLRDLNFAGLPVQVYPIWHAVEVALILDQGALPSTLKEKLKTGRIQVLSPAPGVSCCGKLCFEG